MWYYVRGVCVKHVSLGPRGNLVWEQEVGFYNRQVRVTCISWSNVCQKVRVRWKQRHEQDVDAGCVFGSVDLLFPCFNSGFIQVRKILQSRWFSSCFLCCHFIQWSTLLVDRYVFFSGQYWCRYLEIYKHLLTFNTFVYVLITLMSTGIDWLTDLFMTDILTNYVKISQINYSAFRFISLPLIHLVSPKKIISHSSSLHKDIFCGHESWGVACWDPDIAGCHLSSWFPCQGYSRISTRWHQGSPSRGRPRR